MRQVLLLTLRRIDKLWLKILICDITSVGFQSALQVPLGKLHVVNFEQVSVFCILDCIYTSVIIGDASVNPFIHCSVAMFLCYFDSNVYC